MKIPTLIHACSGELSMVKSVIVVYVDNTLLASKTKENEERTLLDLSSRFKFKDLGEAEFYLDVISRGTGKQGH